VKIREGQVANRPVCLALGVTVDGERDVLGPGSTATVRVVGHPHVRWGRLWLLPEEHAWAGCSHAPRATPISC
jgi:Transposase, Mutator family